MSRSFSDPEREKLSGEITALQALEHCDRRVPTSQLIRSYRTWTGLEIRQSRFITEVYAFGLSVKEH